MQTIVRYLLMAVLLALTSSCASTQSGNMPYEHLTTDAIHHFGKLRQAGKLPGIAKDEHGNVETGAIPESKRVTYPVTVTLHVNTKAQKSRYGYTLTKDRSWAQWHLTRAWKIQPEGQQEALKIE